MPFKYATLIDRIIANSVPSEDSFYNGTPCWEWIGSTITNRGGMRYGTITRRIVKGPRKGKVTKELAHRVVIKGVKGRRLSRRSVGMHLCNNSLCVNPEHLGGGKQKTNVRQCVKDGRQGNQYRAPVAEMREAA